MILKTQSKMNQRKKTMMMKNKRIKIMNNEIKRTFGMAIAATAKSLCLGSTEKL